jgi:two-component system sensor histidine kinase PilS (NtrC family)
LASRDLDSRALLARVLIARVALGALSLAIVLGLDWAAGGLSPLASQGLYLTVALGFASILASALWLRGLGRTDFFTLTQIGLDVAMVTSLVHFSGDPESVFTFLYLIVTIYAAILYRRRGAMVSAGLSTLAYGGLILATYGGWVVSYGTDYARSPLSVLAAAWSVRVSALFLVAVLASFLSRELNRTGRALDEKTSDLGELRELYEQTVVSIMSGLLTTDENGRVTSFNPEAERITGLPRSRVLGRGLEEIIPGASEIVAESALASHVKRISRARLRYANAHGENLFLGVAGSILKGADGGQRGHVVIFQNVTAVAAMERELRSSERLAAVGEMAAKLAHEIRNPLASISGSIQMLKVGQTDRQSEQADADRLMEIVLRETERLNTLIGQFLQYSRPVPPALEPVPVRALLEEMKELLEASKPDEVELECSGAEGLEILADRNQLKQVLWNLAINGLHAMPKGGILTLSVSALTANEAQDWHPDGRRGEGNDESRHPEVEIAISDSGVGILPEHQERIFEPFFTTKAEGTGLGLATVHRVVEGHGGSIRVESQEGGTTFRLRLPGSGEKQ